jgi:CheY-like chemotaxis protein
VTLLEHPMPASRDAGPWQARSEAQLLRAQLQGLAAWHGWMRTREVATDAGSNRESRLDAARSEHLRDRERHALRVLATSHLADSLGQGTAPRAVVAHRQDWLREKLCQAFQDLGVAVLMSTDDGAEAAAAVVLGQPDIIFLEDLLPTVTGVELIRRCRVFAPDALVGVHALGPGDIASLLDAGARAGFSRRIPPGTIAAELLACLHGRHAALTLE